jgi:hypothetical protein
MLLTESRTGLALVDSEDIPPPQIDRDALRRAVGDLLQALGEGRSAMTPRSRQEFLALTARTSHDC